MRIFDCWKKRKTDEIPRPTLTLLAFLRSLDFDTLSTIGEWFSTYQLTVMPMELEPNSEQVSSCNMCRKGISITKRGWWKIQALVIVSIVGKYLFFMFWWPFSSFRAKAVTSCHLGKHVLLFLLENKCSNYSSRICVVTLKSTLIYITNNVIIS